MLNTGIICITLSKHTGGQDKIKIASNQWNFISCAARTTKIRVWKHHSMSKQMS